MRCIFVLCGAQPARIETVRPPWGESPAGDGPGRLIAEHELVYVGPGQLPSMLCPASLMRLELLGTDGQRKALAREQARLLRQAGEAAVAGSDDEAPAGPKPTSQPMTNDSGRPAVEASASWSGRDMTDEPGVSYAAAASSPGTSSGMGHGMASIEETKAALLGVENLVVEALASLRFAVDKADEARSLAIAVLQGSSDVHIIVQLSSGIEKLHEAAKSLQGAHGSSESYRGSY